MIEVYLVKVLLLGVTVTISLYRFLDDFNEIVPLT